MPRVLVPLLVALLAGCGGASGGGESAAEPPASVECVAAYRDSVSVPELEDEALRLEGHGARARAAFAELEVHAELTSWPTEGWGLVLYVTHPDEEERLAQQTYAVPAGEAPPNAFGRLPDGHGFTGLHHHYAASGAELQYFCGVP